MTYEMKRRIGEVMSVAPWTEMDISGNELIKESNET